MPDKDGSIQVSGFRFRVSEFKGLGFGFRVSGFKGCRVRGLGFRFRDWLGLGGSTCRVSVKLRHSWVTFYIFMGA